MPALGTILSTDDIPSGASGVGASCKLNLGSTLQLSTDTGLTPVLITGFITEAWKDVAGMHSTVTNPARLNMTSVGRYQIKCGVAFGSDGFGERYLWVEHVKPTTSGLAAWTKIRTASPSRNMTLDLVVDVATTNVDEYCQLRCAQNSGSSLELVQGPETWFEITKIA